MVITDIVQESDTTHEDTVANYPDAGYGGYSSVSNSANGYNQTPADYAEVTSGNPNSGFTFSQTHTFASAQTVKQLIYKVYAYANIGTTTYTGGLDVEVKVEYYNGSWNTAASDSDTWEQGDQGSEANTLEVTLDASLGGNWEDVTKVRITANARTWHSGGESDSGSCKGRIYDCRAEAFTLQPDNQKCYSGVIF